MKLKTVIEVIDFIDSEVEKRVSKMKGDFHEK